MTRRRAPRNRSWSFLGGLVVVGLIGLVIASGSVPTTTFTSAAVPRGGAVDVVTDDSGIVSLTAVSTVQPNNPQPEDLVDVANYVSADPITVTMTLENGLRADLVGPAGSTGDSINFGVANGQTRTVQLDTTWFAQDGDFITYNIDAQGTGIRATLNDRSVYVSADGSGYSGPTASFWGFGWGQCNFDASGSTPESRITTYEWDFDGDGTYDRTTTSATTSYSYPNGVTPDPTLRVTDDVGQTDTAQPDWLWC